MALQNFASRKDVIIHASYSLSLLTMLSASAEIRIVCTAALIDTQADRRATEYTRSLDIIQQFGYMPYVVEACKKQGPTFLEALSDHVFYSTMNNAALRNKGVNEAKTFLQGLKAFGFDENDMIVKLTGRYYFTSDYFLRMIEKNPDIDAFSLRTTSFPGIDAHTLSTHPFDMFTGCFALRYKHFIAMLESFDLEAMERDMECIEWACDRYIRTMHQKGLLNALYVDKLDVQGKVFYSGDTPLDELPLWTW
ncbi:hypothetical protein JST99_00045 [Candidatus Dependentiae bacterium]|nr:hypothetical protein [Candidatus Dependentiae bacterium]